jgi:hypothetical protein
MKDILILEIKFFSQVLSSFINRTLVHQHSNPSLIYKIVKGCCSYNQSDKVFNLD